MGLKLLIPLAILLLTYFGFADAHNKKIPIPRPEIKAWPLSPGRPQTVSPARSAEKVCFVIPSLGPGRDDALEVLKAFKDCNEGGTVVLDGSYVISSPLDLTFLKAVDVALSGTVTFSENVHSWIGKTFQMRYQNSSAMWKIGGEDVNIYGGGLGLLDGNGQAWWDAATSNSTLRRPILFVIDGLKGGSVTGLKMKNPPMVFPHMLSQCRKLQLTRSDEPFSGSTSLPTAATSSSPTWFSPRTPPRAARPPTATDGTRTDRTAS
jgi:galacturan 1,4-alpha-galacturonidase